MHSRGDKVYSYRYLLSVTWLFSALTNFIFLCYLLLEKRFFAPFEPLIIGVVICVFLSALGQRLSKISGIGKWIFGISTYSSIANYMFFVSNRKIDLFTIMFFFVFLFFLLPFLFWMFLLQPLMKYVSLMKFSIKARAIILGSGLLIVFILVFASVFYQEMMSFLDAHSWVIPLVGVIVSILIAFKGGISIGRQKRS